MLSAICSSLDPSTILLSGNGLKMYNVNWIKGLFISKVMAADR